jgi:putative Mn2+ efflux pump MntP
MEKLTLLGIAWALAMDAFAVSASVSSTMPAMTGRHMFRLAWHFGVFQGGMAVLGWAGGTAVAAVLAEIDHWIAFGVLFVLGLRMIRESMNPGEEGRSVDPTRGWSLVGLSVATSMDALAVGVSFGLMRLPIWTPSLVIGGVAFLLSLVGCRLGSQAGRYLGRWAERVGGVVLIGIGAHILFQHLTEVG